MGLMRLMGLMGPMGLMRPMRPISLMSLVALIALMGMGLTGCSSDMDEVSSEGAVRRVAAPIEVTSFVAWYEETLATRRAWTPPTGYELYSEPDNAIGVAFTQNNKDPLKGSFFKSSGKWRTNVELETAGDYYIYGYVPNKAGVTMTVTDRVGGKAHYSEGAIVKLENVPSVMPSDLCVIIGAKDGTDKDTDAGLRQGDFCYRAHAIKDDSEDDDEEAEKNFVFLLFDHLYASLRIKMRVNGDYAALRTIKLKSLLLNTTEGETPSRQKTDITIELKATDVSVPSESPIVDIIYEPKGGVIDGGLEFWSSAAGEQLSTSYKTHVGHFMPNGVTKLILTSVYDVYDTNGNLIRKDCKATNTMELKKLFTGQEKTRRGCRYTVNMTINPTYLYLLSEPDLNNPTVTVE